jgi:hypothetical protein
VRHIAASSAHAQLLGTCLLLLLALLRHQVPERQIVHHVFNVLNPVLQPVATAAQAIVFEVENLEARMQVLDELVDEQRALVVAESDGVACKAGLTRLAWGVGIEIDGRTSSSTSVMRDWRYSSSERWNSSRSLRLTGTA